MTGTRGVARHYGTMDPETHTCTYCAAVLTTSEAGLAAHQKRCRDARQWQRDYFLERGKWPSRKVNRSSFLAGGHGGRRVGRDPSAT